MNRLITRVVFSLSLIFILTSTSAAQGDTVSVRTEQKTSTADVAETDSIAADTAMTAFAEAPEDFAPAADNGGIYNSIKVKFIEGNVGFMSLVALALIIGLTFCIERIIYLSLSEINTRKLLEDLEVLPSITTRP